jgi:hypothetical protein
MCCGQKRLALQASLGQATTATARTSRISNLKSTGASGGAGRPAGAQLPAGPGRTAAVIQALHAPVNLRYLKNSTVRVRGAATGRPYEFSASRPAKSVET